MNEPNDHDLLIKLYSEVQNIGLNIQDMKNDTSKRLERLESDVATLKFWRGVLVGAWGVTSVIIIPLIVSYVGSGNIHVAAH